MSDERGNTISALSLGSPNIWPMAAAYIMCVQVTSIQNISRVLSLAGETEGDTVPSKYSPTHLWMLGFLLHFGPSSLSFSFLFPGTGRAVNARGPRCLGFLAWKPCSLLASAERGICCVESVAFPLWSGFHLWSGLLSRVTGLCQCLASGETEIVSPEDWGPSVVCPSCLSRACCCICCPPLEPLPATLENTNQIVRILWITFSPPVQHLRPSMCFYLWNYNGTFFPPLTQLYMKWTKQQN